MKNSQRIKQVLQDIAKDAEDDAKNFDGKPFTGKNVAEYLGNHGASIATLAKICEKIVEEIDEHHKG